MENQFSADESESEGSTLTTLKTIDGVCRDHSGNGILSIGANAALQAMSPHWAVHLAEGHGPEIISEDIDELMSHLGVLRAELVRQLGLTPTGAAGQADSQLGAISLALKYRDGHPQYTRAEWREVAAQNMRYWPWVHARIQASVTL